MRRRAVLNPRLRLAESEFAPFAGGGNWGSSRGCASCKYARLVLFGLHQYSTIRRTVSRHAATTRGSQNLARRRDASKSTGCRPSVSSTSGTACQAMVDIRAKTTTAPPNHPAAISRMNVTWRLPIGCSSERQHHRPRKRLCTDRSPTPIPLSAQPSRGAYLRRPPRSSVGSMRGIGIPAPRSRCKLASLRPRHKLRDR